MANHEAFGQALTVTTGNPTQRGVRNPGARQSDLAFQALHRAVVTCALAPGSTFTEQQLMERFGLKRAATRSALERLAAARLVQPARRMGYTIRPITLREVVDSIQLAEILIVAACRLAAGKVDEKELRKFDEVCARGYKPSDVASVDRFLTAEAQLYKSIAKATGNIRLVAVLEQTITEIGRLLHFGLKVGGARDPVMGHQHTEFIEALANGDAPQAEGIIRNHFARTSALIMKSLMSSDELLDVSISAATQQAWAA